jgi:FkbM family methyltransferase
MKKLLKKIVRSFGLEVHRIPKTPSVPKPAKTPAADSMTSAMQRMKELGVNPACIIDLGAAAGTWTMKAEKIWPSAEYVLFEPLEERKAELNALAEKNKKIKPVFAAAGNKSGSVKFMVSDDLDGSGVYDAEKNGGNREVRLTTIDEEIKNLKQNGDYLVKFDTHGFEVPILEGAKETLGKTRLVIMECYGFRIADNCLLFPEMCAYMEKLGFRLADIINVLHRPGDNLFWQCDAFFLPATHPSFNKNTYR